jgi:hypothetical protein
MVVCEKCKKWDSSGRWIDRLENHIFVTSWWFGNVHCFHFQTTDVRGVNEQQNLKAATEM